MTHSTVHRLARLVCTTSIALVLVAGVEASASAGGWALGSVDAIPEAAPGETADVGFTVLQHGVRPVDLAEDVGIELVLADGTTKFFEATSAGATGHYVAAVTFPSAPGEYSWNLRMGWFGTQDLGTLDVKPTGLDDQPVVWSWSTTRWVTLVAAAALAAIAVADLLRTRRHAPATQS